MCICVSFSYWFSRFIKEWYVNANQFVFECSGLVALYLERRCMYYPCVCILIILYIIRPLLFCYSSQTHIIVCLSVRVCMCVCVSVCIQMRKPDTNILLCVVFMAGVCICRYFFFFIYLKPGKLVFDFFNNLLLLLLLFLFCFIFSLADLIYYFSLIWING